MWKCQITQASADFKVWFFGPLQEAWLGQGKSKETKVWRPESLCNGKRPKEKMCHAPYNNKTFCTISIFPSKSKISTSWLTNNRQQKIKLFCPPNSQVASQDLRHWVFFLCSAPPLSIKARCYLFFLIYLIHFHE